MMTTETTSYPVHVDARLDDPLSRGLWLVKWILAIPHYVILVFLWVAFVVTSLMAFFAILVTKRYPRVLFDFNVGVLRWSWRVSFYAYGALGTDRYPPFSLHDVAEYPAHLEIDYPEQLSRGLVLVKWWLLIIPHFLVLGLFLGGAGYVAQDRAGESFSGMGLIGLLVLVAGVLLLFTGRYPIRLFDLILGLNRWVLRVAGYVALMTDRYPPFALDQGGDDPGTVSVHTSRPVPTAAGLLPHPAEQTVAPTRRSGWTAGRTASLAIGSVILATSLGLAAAAVTVAVINESGRDQDGFLMSDTQDFDTPTHAIISTNLQLHSDVPGDFLPSRLLGKARITAEPEGGRELFIGVAATSDVQRYLAQADHASVTGADDGEPDYRTHTGSTSPTTPTDETFWVAEDSGPGQRSITWDLDEGDWTVVLMNADGSAAVAGELAVGAELPAVEGAVVVLAALAGLALIVGGVLVALPIRGASRRRDGA